MVKVFKFKFGINKRRDNNRFHIIASSRDATGGSHVPQQDKYEGAASAAAAFYFAKSR